MANETQQTEQPDWNKLGGYFEHIFASGGTHESWQAPARFRKLEDSYNQFAEYSDETSSQMCMPLAEAWAIAVKPELEEKIKLTQEQAIHVQMVKFTLNTTEGFEIAKDLLSTDPILCVDNEAEAHGYYKPLMNIAAYQLENTKEGIDRTKNLLDGQAAEAANVFGTFAEELAHAAQHKIWKMILPSDTLRFQRPEEKIWNISTEAHAKLIAARMILSFAQNNDNPYLLTEYIQENSGTAHMLGKLLMIQIKHGSEALQEEPTLLSPVYKSFFEYGPAIEAYTNTSCLVINQYTSPDNRNKIPTEHYINKFGNIPGVEGNVLKDVLSGKEVQDIAGWTPEETELAQWLKASFKAAHDGKPLPPLAPDVPGCQVDQPTSPSPAATTATQASM